MRDIFTAEFWKEILDKFIEWSVSELPSILILIVVLIITLRVVKFAVKRLRKFLVARADRRDGDDTNEAEKRVATLMGILHGITKVVIWTLFLMILLNKLGINIGPILAGAGILGLAVGFGAQELVRDVITGFFILLENQIRTGDVAIINGTGGLVEKIELRTVTLRDFSGVVHIFQNGKINTLSNMTKEWSAMVFDIGVAYKENTDTVMEVIRQVGNELQQDEEYGPKIIEPIEVFGVDKFGDSAVVIKARFKTKPIEQWNVGREFRRRLKHAFDERKIEIPFPHTTVYWGEEITPLQLKLREAE
ncbi:MAG TPA: mechanosensitive ion channel family protein [Bacteroides sp.]|nr:mechanosensitive ion channel family protein [Bacteroides sp.]